MKVVLPKEMARIEGLAYDQGADEADFMERAGRGVAEAALKLCFEKGTEQHFVLLCGKGNNAGDAYVAGRLLLGEGAEVQALQLGDLDTCSPLCRQNYHRFVEAGGQVQVFEEGMEPSFPESAVLLDGIFGTGFQGEARGSFGDLIQQANASGLPILAIDIPSALDGATGEALIAIRATTTLFLGLPKRGFFFEKGPELVGTLCYASFGLDPKWIDQADSVGDFLWAPHLRTLMPQIVRTRHKYEAGFVVAAAGSPGMPGAAMLACTAAMRSGAGIVYLFHPPEMHGEFAAAPYELVRKELSSDSFGEFESAVERAQALLVGPGMGKSEHTRSVLRRICQLDKAMVLDADALNGLAAWDLVPPQHSVLTPHLGEMQRLLGLEGKQSVDAEFLALCQDYVERYQLTLILKGAHSFILSPGCRWSVSAAGDPGMATAGTGDVLCGIVAALLAQGLNARDAACLGCALHSMAGRAAARELSSYSVVASDLIEQLPEVFLEMQA